MSLASSMNLWLVCKAAQTATLTFHLPAYLPVFLPGCASVQDCEAVCTWLCQGLSFTQFNHVFSVLPGR